MDVPDAARAVPLLDTLAGHLSWVKLGLQLFLREGPSLLDVLAKRNLRVFLDLKLHDIPNTVASAIRSLKGRPVSLLTVHALGGPAMLRAAVDAQQEALPGAGVLAVTILTSMDQSQLGAIGLAGSPAENVHNLAGMALATGVAGLVCSPLETAALRKAFGNRPHLVTPGIRPADGPADDQARVATPASAAMDGSSHLVIGRPLLHAADPLKVLTEIRRELTNLRQ